MPSRVKTIELEVKTSESLFKRDRASAQMTVLYILVEIGFRFITTGEVVKDATLAELCKLIEIYLCADNQPLTFLVVGFLWSVLATLFMEDITGAPVLETLLATELPFCNQSNGHLTCL
ncbi:Kinesin-like protein [Melia azedarach]|uniref:Kinesin-like protein n=1 Tax=Melia azedarach TaxID=155640 RepID=A0ACC1YIA5_MELAZ|nr:Kinesin-like protein [Melia azedarach]